MLDMTAADAAPDLASYSTIVVAFSGGKDSLACVLHLLELGVARDRIELWHHDVDGREGSDLMDWPVTRDYCRAVADALGVRLYYSWKVGGFEGEMDRRDRPTAPTRFETPDGVRETGGRGKPGTRGLFPQVSADLKVRWCSAYLKIDVCAAALRNQPRFENARTLVVSGERAEESANRARYRTFERDRADNRDGSSARHVDRWRPVHAWSSADVWSIIARHRINPHPAYRIGLGRVSCMNCIFQDADQAATIAAIAPANHEQLARKEEASGKTIKRGKSVRHLAVVGNPIAVSDADRRAALSRTFDEPAVLDVWSMPAGAHATSSCGPS